MKTPSPLVEQTDLGLSLFRNVRLGRILSETEVIPRDANTHFCFQPGSPLKHEDVIPPELCRTKSSSNPTLDHACPPLSHPETFSIPHTLASGPAQLPFFSPFLRRYKFNSDLETNSGILIRTMESEAKGLCVDKTKSTLEASGGPHKAVMTASSLTAARRRRDYSLKLSFKNSIVCHLDLVVVLSISGDAGLPPPWWSQDCLHSLLADVSKCHATSGFYAY